jgi:cytochrome c oxidase assembly protein subunit 15
MERAFSEVQDQPSQSAPIEGPSPLLRRLGLLTAHLVVALLALVAIGGATRVMEAGLACPDWPLCYGQLLPASSMTTQVFLEWFHRLDAFCVGVALLVLAAVAGLQRRRLPPWLAPLALLALLLVVMQATLGALTVTQLLPSGVVTAHLALALLLVALVSGLHQRLALHIAGPASGINAPLPRWWRALVPLTLLAVAGQALLGGAMASQWAVDRCLAAGEACIWLGLHRAAAGPVAASVGILALVSLALPRGQGQLRALTMASAVLVAVQIGLGLASLRSHLALPAIVVAHQLVAALLVALLAAAWSRSLGGPSGQGSPLAGPAIGHPSTAIPVQQLNQVQQLNHLQELTSG